MTEKKLNRLHLTNSKISETVKNKNLTKILLELIEIFEREFSRHLDDDGKIEKVKSNLLYQLGSRLKKQFHQFLSFLTRYIGEGKLSTELQLTEAINYLMRENVENVEKIDVSSFEKVCGVGVIVTADEIDDVVTEVIEFHKKELLEERYRFNTNRLMTEIRNRLKWANGRIIKGELDVKLHLLLGGKTDDDLKMNNKKKVKKVEKTTIFQTDKKMEIKNENRLTLKDLDEENSWRNFIESGEATRFHKTGENYKTDGYVITDMTMKLLKEHLERTKGQVRTRFPPEPNGILHVGHAKAININFAFAKVNNGITFLRYDDTNPEKEEERFFHGILDAVNWLGYTPYKVTHASDYFPRLYECAIELIKRDLAYVCHQKSDEIKGHNPPSSPWRERPIKESLELFEGMKKGKMEEGEATLRMKHTLEDGKQDPVCYRVKYSPHHRTGNEWCIYPTYDFTHCLCDSFEDITHSLCTKEFQARRSSYYWLCNALDLYCPVQWEYGRLNLNYSVVSKRKIQKLIEENIVNDWDDPRLFTLAALKRRGVPSIAINRFVQLSGITMSQTVIDPIKLDACIRDVLNLTASRAMCVIEPLKVKLLNQENARTIQVPLFPDDMENPKKNEILFEKNYIFIERADFQMNPTDKSYKRLSPKQPVGLRYGNILMKVVKVKEKEKGEIEEIHCEIEPLTSDNKPKGFIHWVSQSTARNCEIHMYERLFKHAQPEKEEGGFVNDCEKDSHRIFHNVKINEAVTSLKERATYQFERNGYFAIDKESKNDKIIFNHIVSLKESKK
ncbi:hypothetical protein SNEBB_009328 [Seison nebaliae]|nr:hypothetical protein SNEBB_009328 [Seison nebaliae]